MITLNDHAKAGRTTYQASGYRWDGDDNLMVNGASGEYRTLAAAKLAARSWLRKGADQFAVYRGTYQAQDIPDEQYGVIRTADWTQDEHWICNGWAADGGIQWETEAW